MAMDGLPLCLLLFIAFIGAVQSYPCYNNYECTTGLGYCDSWKKDYDKCKCKSACICYDPCSSGSKCETVKTTAECNRCAPFPCPNTNYTCKPLLNAFDCVCAPGYTGYSCEFLISSACASYPCLNGGSCVEGATTGTYTCDCTSKYDGAQCQHAISDPCVGVSCLNGGKCTPVLGNTRSVCSCPAAWQGARCEQPVSVRTCGTPCEGNCFVATAVLNTTSFTVGSSDRMTNSQCAKLMNATATYEFYIVAGSNCYLGANQLLTQPSNDSQCETTCPGDGNARCGTYEFARVYLYPYTADPKQCTAISCGTSVQGYCVEQMEGFSCVCAPGRIGDHCQNPENPCTTQGCQNGANCLPTEDNAAARCICARGFSGEKCEGKDQCFFAPCKNGGKCTNTNTAPGFNCQCNEAYYGDTCENFSACKGEPCLHGNCTDTSAGNYKCACEPGWKGTDCDQDIDECLEAKKPLCENHGTCVNTVGSYECACLNGTFGFDCSINPDDCNMTYLAPDGHNYTNLCIYLDVNATCVDGYDDYSCNCSAGFKGSRCWDDIDECAEAAALGGVLCEYNSTCNNTIGSYFCDCRRGTFGFNCSYKPDECKENPVVIDGKQWDNACIARDPNATCTDDFGFYTCTCGQFWTGPQCLDDIDECALNPTPCKLFSTCHNLIGDYECKCINGTEGKNCDINPDDCLNIDACNATDKLASCTDGFAEWWCTCGPDYTGRYCDLEMIIYNVLQLLGGGTKNEADLILMMRDLLRNPSKMKDLVPFIIGLRSKENRTAMSWTADDFFLWVAYEEKRLNLNVDMYRWNDVVLGNCFTFNHFNNTERAYRMRSDGAQGGLKAAVKMNTDEYLRWTETTAIMTFIHPNTETIFSESPRYNAKPAAETTILTTESRFKRLGGHYGKCVKSTAQIASYYYEGSYTTDGCLRSCYQDEVKKKCECMDSRYPMPSDENACDVPNRECVDSIIAKGDVSTWAKCVCPLPCENSQFEASFTMAPFVRSRNRCNAYTAAQQVNNTACVDMEMDTDYLIINVQVPRITINIFQEDPAWTLNRLIGNIGGLGGVVCGINLITFFEFGFFFLFQLPMTLFFNRRL